MSLLQFSRRLLLAGAASLAIAGAALTGIGEPSTAQETKLVDGKLPVLANGFPKRPIILLVVDEPGSTDSVFASQIAEAASKISPQPVLVEHRIDFTTFGTWEALAWVRDQGKIASDGYLNYIYTLPDAMIDLLAVDIKSQVGVDIED